MALSVGSFVKYSWSALEPVRSNAQGGYSQRLRDSARREYERRSALVGKVTGVMPAANGGTIPAVSVEWSDGTRSTCFADLLAPVETFKATRTF